MDEPNQPKDIVSGVDEIEANINKNTIYASNMRMAAAYKFGILDIVKDLDKFKNFNCLITSKTNSGKSVFLKDICSQIKGWYTSVYVFSLTSYLQPDLFDFVPKENIIHTFDQDKLRGIWQAQEQEIMRLRRTKIKEENLPRVLILYDDLISDPKVRNSPILKQLFVMARHAKISQIFLSQSFTAVPPVLRKNVAMAISFYLDSETDRKAFCESYLSTKNVRLGMMVFDKVTKEPYQAICILNCKTDSNPENYVKTYKAKLKVAKFLMGANKKTIKNIARHVIEPSPAGGSIEGLMPKIKSKIKRIDSEYTPP